MLNINALLDCAIVQTYNIILVRIKHQGQGLYSNIAGGHVILPLMAEIYLVIFGTNGEKIAKFCHIYIHFHL